MKHFLVTLFCPHILLAFATVLPAGATAIDFEAQATNRGGNLTGIPDSPLTIGMVTFTGGELLDGEVGLNTDPTGVYASEGLFGSGESNPLVITFATPVQTFSVLVLNGDDTRSYTVSDNLGDSITKSLASAGGLGHSTFSLPRSGVTGVSITSANADGWDFAIDDMSFTTTTGTPEPGSLFLLCFGCVLLAAMGRSRLGRRLLK